MSMNENLLEPLSRLFGLLRDTNRLKILFAIGKERESVSEIMDETSSHRHLYLFI
jgi:hypothetical protein